VGSVACGAFSKSEFRNSDYEHVRLNIFDRSLLFQALSMTDSTTKKYRTLRAIEGEGEDQKTKDFQVRFTSGAFAFVLGESRVPELF
jgi:hypothetical protein